MDPDKEKIIKNVFKFTSARYLSLGIGVITAIVIRHFLGPFYMGIWGLLKIALSYSSYLLLGADRGTAYKIPLLIGQGDKQTEEEINRTALGFMSIIAAFTSVGLLVAAVILRNRLPVEAVIGLCFLSLYLILERICSYYRLLLRARQNFSILSKSIIFDAVANLVLVLLLVSSFKIYGLYVASLLLGVLNIFFMHILARYKFGFSFNLKKVSELIAIGFPLTIVVLLRWTLNSLDRIMIAKMIGVTFVGYYSIPIMAKSYIGQMSSFGTVLYPKILETYGRKQSIDAIKKYVIIPPMINAYMLPPILGLIFLIVPLLVEKILPRFIPGILAMQILLLDIFFCACYHQAHHFLFTLKKQARVMPIVASAIILNIIGNYIFIKRGYGIYGVAWATSVVSFLSFIAAQSYAMRHFARMKEIFLFLIKIVFPLIYIALIVLILERYVAIRNIFLDVSIKSCALAILSTPLLFYINKKTEIVTFIFSILKKKIAAVRSHICFLW